VFLSSTSKGLLTLTYGSIKWPKDKGILSAERRQRLDRIGFVLDADESRWEKGFAALAKFKARKGHCRVPCIHIEGKFRLGRWVLLQRKVKDKILAKRRKRLNAIGFVWDGRKQFWENGFTALTKFKAREGHCHVPSLRIERKFKLGQWVTTQRRSKEEMPFKRRSQLNKIGFVWRVL
jgi:hypothetical protein